MVPIKITGAGAGAGLAELVVPERLVNRWPGVADLEGPLAPNVARTYASFAADLHEGTRATPSFEDAVTRHGMLDAIQRSAESGQRVAGGRPAPVVGHWHCGVRQKKLQEASSL
jgi:hypothetical protein